MQSNSFGFSIWKGKTNETLSNPFEIQKTGIMPVVKMFANLKIAADCVRLVKLSIPIMGWIQFLPSNTDWVFMNWNPKFKY